ncbi:hypothetical protein CSC17_0388 [Klebsiella oxytoca]|nr:hypothetical protein CSC17_0388 [Klebsiella oxytoca]EUC83906.1 hypothetical protein HMPREF1570_2567 [Klebsiella oxytoca KA-2]EUC88942.1 hypothetical protein HMPREF1569_2898 [Klebsiella oxytoca OK-1]
MKGYLSQNEFISCAMNYSRLPMNRLHDSIWTYRHPEV